jgi:hypothetical protein
MVLAAKPLDLAQAVRGHYPGDEHFLSRRGFKITNA